MNLFTNAKASPRSEKEEQLSITLVSAKTILVFCLYALLTCMGSRSAAQNTWQLKKNQDAIQVYTRSGGDSRYNELKVEYTGEGTLSSLAAVLLDVSNHINWVYGTHSAFLLKKISPAEMYFYTEVNSPWPVANRDLPVHVIITQDSITKVMRITADDVPDLVKVKKGIVRVPLSKATWKVVPASKGKITIDYELQVDIGGIVPPWLFNMFCARAPYESFKKLTEEMQLPKYKNAVVSFIRN